MRGWVYVISNPAMPGLLKVGYSMKDPQLRALEFGGTGVPHSYHVEWDILLDNPRKIEQEAHSRLTGCREAKEWFRCSVVEAIQAIKKAATGICHYAERGGPKNIANIPYPFEINNPDIAYELSNDILDGIIDCNEQEDADHPKSWHNYFRRALELKSIYAWLDVAYSLASGLHRKNDSAAFISYKPGLSDSAAQEEANQILENVFPEFLKRAKSGDANAAETVGKLYLIGLGIPKDDAEAIFWLSKAAAKDDGSTALYLASKYSSGQLGAVINHTEAVKWYQVSAQRGSFGGAAMLARAYRDGLGVPANIEAAKYWAQRAFEMNSAAASTFWNISDLLSPEV